MCYCSLSNPVLNQIQQPFIQPAKRQAHFRSSLISLRKIADAIFRRERSDDRKCVWRFAGYLLSNFSSEPLTTKAQFDLSVQQSRGHSQLKARIKLPGREAAFWFVYAVMQSDIIRRNDIGLLNVVLAYIVNQPMIKYSLTERISLTPRKAFRVRISSEPNVNQIKIVSRHKACMSFTESFLKGLPLQQSRSESSVTLKSPPRIILSSSFTTQSSICLFKLSKKMALVLNLSLEHKYLQTKMANLGPPLQL